MAVNISFADPSWTNFFINIAVLLKVSVNIAIDDYLNIVYSFFCFFPLTCLGRVVLEILPEKAASW